MRIPGTGRRHSHYSRAVVTGAGSGIGRAFAMELGRRGGDVICSDISMELAEETAEMVRDLGVAAHAVRCDVSVLSQVQTLATRAEEVFDKPVSLLINNAGVGAGGQRIGELGQAEWDRGVSVNLWGPIHGCETFVPIFRENRSGGIINVASAAAFGAAPLMGPYCVSKAGVLALSEVLAAELTGSGVSVSVLCPTLVKTNIASSTNVDESSREAIKRTMDLAGFSPERVARMTLDAHDAGKFYILPQPDAKLAWALKRHLPLGYLIGMKTMNTVMTKYSSNQSTSDLEEPFEIATDPR